MISLLTMILPMLVKNTPMSFVSTAFVALLLTVNIVMQFHLVVGARSSAAFASPFGVVAPTVSGQAPSSSSLLWAAPKEVSDDGFWTRRSFLVFMTPALFAQTARAADNSTVDWDAFGASLQQSTPAVLSQPGGSDLQKALQDSSKRKQIDPRTHG
ncbi:expressed unknown protein [Seminavis robusta]|uniref:Uncharacterized protein n=1 Tax=Seminavis robusta TaxID=568900 RepID=A0A9N8DAM6_9STRA|nr:expressed unknown protein [Seminavis robusta]|eukprot:Sro35_g022330.1 n/a (156) ;mRNA; f:72544-73011